MQASGDGFDGSQRIVQFMPQHADQPLPGCALLRAGRGSRRRARPACAARPFWRNVLRRRTSAHRLLKCNGDHQAFSAVRQSFSPSSSAVRPSSRTAACCSRRSPAGLTSRKTSSGSNANKRNVDFFDHAPQQSGGLDRTDALVGEQVGKRIDFQRKLSQSVFGAAPRAKGIVLFAQSGDHIRQSLQRANRLLVQAQRPAATRQQVRRRSSASLDSIVQDCSQIRMPLTSNPGTATSNDVRD